MYTLLGLMRICIKGLIKAYTFEINVSYPWGCYSISANLLTCSFNHYDVVFVTSFLVTQPIRSTSLSSYCRVV